MSVLRHPRLRRQPDAGRKESGRRKMEKKDRKIRVTACDQTRKYPFGITYGEIARDYADILPYPALLVKERNNRLHELNRHVYEDCSIEFVTLMNKEGRDTYRRSLCLLMLKAIDNLLGREGVHVWIRFSVSNGLFCTLEHKGTAVTQQLIDQVKAEMERLRDLAIPFRKENLGTDEAVHLFEDNQMTDKARLFRYRISSRTNIYNLDGFKDYYYGYMVQDTSFLSLFDLKPYRDGFVLLFPSVSDPSSIPPFEPVDKLFDVQHISRIWGKRLGVHTVGDLNDLIASGRTRDLVLMQEALQEKQIANLAEEIEKKQSVKIIFIAGPSSSSKTTFSHRLSIQLSCYGLIPHPIAMDNYFKNRSESPRNPDGTYNFECLEALDVEQFNKDMTELMEGRSVRMPTYDFINGERQYKGNTLQISDRDVLVIEGIHGLNDAFSYSIPQEKKFKIYISALTQLNIDEHNRIPTTDGRLLRRIIRDERTRGYNAQDTIAIWKSVRKGEEDYIFPFQESSDVMFNSALVYELAVLKTYAEPLLHAVPKDSKEWVEAKRLLKFLDYFLPIPADDIPKNSLIREFIGGGCFDV